MEFFDFEIVEMKVVKMKCGSWKVFEIYVGCIKKFVVEVYGICGFIYEDVDWNFCFKLIDWFVK